ncbi:hypothetical protein A3C18_03205 [Candidatus Kaiserbacteria bacterium RIFCSPHIGHO2_02_FULL_54_11b]|uniref:Transposase IS200-like domain-containing protein n=2 Tax=Candidatus Kaiseribacteriota TaxID=1752734 RepID=A0A1F6CR21_9BACT|nr:MAG: hypothetical protein A2704_02485 [Candidatus Kaiserbacteria bacterium RIFCSPHIGHO2_01_FULL_54_36b]OGG63846.1 MAG: hypothetical protein A3C18_03205 [Candidatus Kaiserbacteria bacterium RIFCSPHIGHO2_02_FULL_54_11b]
MSYRRTPFAPGEHYHCYTRGIDGRLTFLDKEDYERFQEALYLCNTIEPFDRSDFLKLDHSEIFLKSRKSPLVSIGCYSLMPNHYHIGFEEIAEGGSSKFLQKLGTAYTMYFNVKYQRVGALFIGPCRSRHIDTDRYFKRVAEYIHLNAAEIFEPKWKSGVVKNVRSLERHIGKYDFSSLRDYAGKPRPEQNILNREMRELVGDGMSPVRNVLAEAQKYYQNLDIA